MAEQESEPASAPQESIQYVYEFVFPDGSTKKFSVRLDYSTLNIVTEPRASYPPWTALEFCQCPNCPLTPREHPVCPVAKTLVHLIDFLRTSRRRTTCWCRCARGRGRSRRRRPFKKA